MISSRKGTGGEIDEGWFKDVAGKVSVTSECRSVCNGVKDDDNKILEKC